MKHPNFFTDLKQVYIPNTFVLSSLTEAYPFCQHVRECLIRFVIQHSTHMTYRSALWFIDELQSELQ
jgi:hypothetical protein